MNSEIFDRAMAIISSRRHKAENENENRIREINEKLPQIREINVELFNSGRELLRIISEGDPNDLQKKIDNLKKYNLDAQSMARTMLVDNGYPADYLDMHYTCPKCSDTGYYNKCYCDCFRQLCGKLSADELNKNAQLKLSSFDTFRLDYYSGESYGTMKRILDFTKKYADEFNASSQSIFMSGRTGLGKTHLSLAIANKVLENGYSVIYDSVINILRNIEKEHFSREHSTEMFDLIMEADLLILDDLGTEYESPFYNATIYNIINTRLNRSKPTIISTNLNFAGIGRRYDERVVSRIVSAYACLEFQGEDVRLQMRNRKLQ